MLKSVKIIRQSMQRIGHLEGIRACGVLIVIMCHFQLLFVRGFYNLLERWCNRVFPASLSRAIVHCLDLNIIGNIAVHIFWMLSAYVLFKRFFERQGPDYLFSFAVKRYFRLMLPCAASVFFSWALLAGGLIFASGVVTGTLFEGKVFTAPASLWIAIKTSLWNTMFHFSGQPGYNEPLWTIEKETYGSLFCLGFYALTARQHSRYCYYLIATLCIVMLHMYWLNSFLFGYILCDYDFSEKKPALPIVSRVDELLSSHQKPALILALCLLAGGYYIIYRNAAQLSAMSSLMGLGLLWVSLRSHAVQKIVSGRIFLTLGSISFGLYVLHWPVMASFTSYAYLHLPETGPFALLLLFVATLIICTALSGLFTEHVDKHSVRWAAKIGSLVTTGRPVRNESAK